MRRNIRMGMGRERGAEWDKVSMFRQRSHVCHCHETKIVNESTQITDEAPRGRSGADQASFESGKEWSVAAGKGLDATKKPKDDIDHNDRFRFASITYICRKDTFSLGPHYGYATLHILETLSSVTLSSGSAIDETRYPSLPINHQDC